MAEDDKLAGTQIVAFYDALKAAGCKPEFYLYTAVMAGQCASKAQQAITGSTNSTGSWKHTG